MRRRFRNLPIRSSLLDTCFSRSTEMRFQRTSTATVWGSIFHHPTNKNPRAATNRVTCFPDCTWALGSMLRSAETALRITRRTPGVSRCPGKLDFGLRQRTPLMGERPKGGQLGYRKCQIGKNLYFLMKSLKIPETRRA